MTRAHTLTLAAALVIAGCAKQAPAPTEAALPPLATKPTVGQEVGAVANDQLEITFASGSTKLSPDAGKKLDVAARLFRDVGPAMMFAVGHADSQGDEYSNVLLSAGRARTVKRALVARGIPPNRLMIEAVGNADPVSHSSPTAPEDRRVVVKWQVLPSQ